MDEIKLFSGSDNMEIEVMSSENDPYTIARHNKIAEHRRWLRTVPKEIPSPDVPYKIGIYIRYYNQTKYENYLDFHIAKYTAGISQFPNWTLVDFYVDKGAVAPRMENATEWSRLLEDCMAEKVDLIVTQKVSNVSRDPMEMAFCARMLASLKHPVGIYFDSEEMFTLASYYMKDLRDPFFLGENDKSLPLTAPGGLLHD